MSVNKAKKRLLVAILGAILCTALCFVVLIQFPKTVTAESSQVKSYTDGIKVTGFDSTDTDSNTLLNMYFKDSVTVGDAKSVIFEVHSFEKTQEYIFALIDDEGNYYEFSGKAYRARSIGLLLSDVSTNFDVSDGGGLSGVRFTGKVYYKMDVENFKLKKNFIEINEGGSTTKETGDALSGDASLFGFSVRFKSGVGNANVIIGDVYLENSDKSVNKICNTEDLIVTADYKKNINKGYAHFAYYNEVLGDISKNADIESSSDGSYGIDGIKLVHIDDSTDAWWQTLQAYTLKDNSVDISLDNVVSFIYEIQRFEKDSQFLPGFIDEKGNIYQYQFKDGVDNASMKYSRTLSGLNNENSCKTVSYPSVTYFNSSTSQIGKTYYECGVDSFYCRGYMNQVTENNNTGIDIGSVLSDNKNSNSVFAVNFVFNSTSIKYADVIFGNIYVRRADGSVDKLLELGSCESLSNYGYTKASGYFQIAKIEKYGTQDSHGWWDTPSDLVMTCSIVKNKTATDGILTGSFDGINIKFNDVTDLGWYTSHTTHYYKLPTYDKTLNNKAVVLRYNDRGGKGAAFQIKVTANDTTYDVTNGIKTYFVNEKFELVKVVDSGWATTPDAGFSGYIIYDFTNAVNKYENLTLTSPQIQLVMNGSWTNGAYLNMDLGYFKAIDISNDAAKLSDKGYDFNSLLIRDGDMIYDFVNDATGGHNAPASWGEQHNYQTGITRVYKDALSIDYFMTTGAQIKITEPSGLRFEANLADFDYDSFIADGYEVSMGILIAPTDYILKNGELSFDNDFFVAGSTMLNVVCPTAESKTENGVDYLYIRGAIVDIFKANYQRNFTGLGYIKLTKENHNDIVIYANADDNSRSIAFIAEKCYNDENSSFYQNEILEKYFSNVD